MKTKTMIKDFSLRLLGKGLLFFIAVLLSCNKTIALTDSTLGQDVPKNKSLVKNEAGLPFIYEAIDTLFGKFVTSDRGLVDYQSIHDDSLLIILKDSIAHFNLGSIDTREDSLAFYINAYNVMVIYYIKDYGLISQASVGFPLFKKKIMIGRETITLDQLEKHDPGYIAQFNDPRTHFALVCAAQSCPPLLNRAYRGETLYKLLDYQTVTFINNSEFNSYDPSPVVSALFSWYASDFTGYVRDSNNSRLIKERNGGKVNDFIASYLNKELHYQSVKKKTLAYKEYDWTVNFQ